MKSLLFHNVFSIILFIFIIIINITFIKTQKSTGYTCENISKIIDRNTTKLIYFIKNNMNSLKSNSHSCIDTLINYCKITALNLYLNELSKLGIKYKENLEISLNTIPTQIDDVFNKHKYIESDYQVVMPASRWAQNMDEIFIEIKFAHRHDSPGCLEMKNLKVELKEKYVTLIGYCILGDIPIKMDFNIKLFNKINVALSKHFQSSVGRYQFNLVKKKKDTYWHKLLDEKTPVPNNMRVWFEMKEKYHDQIAKYDMEENEENLQNIVDTIEMEERKKERKANKTKSKKKKKKKKSQKTTDL